MTHTITATQEMIDLWEVDYRQDDKPTVLLKTEQLTVMRFVLAIGREIPEHKSPKAITVQCITGVVEFSSMGRTWTMTAGRLLYIPADQPHSLRALDDSIVLVTKAN